MQNIFIVPAMQNGCHANLYIYCSGFLTHLCARENMYLNKLHHKFYLKKYKFYPF